VPERVEQHLYVVLRLTVGEPHPLRDRAGGLG
jgi:hypothetical protein